MPAKEAEEAFKVVTLLLVTSIPLSSAGLELNKEVEVYVRKIKPPRQQ